MIARRRITPVPSHILVRVFELAGFQVVRQRGDHIIMTKPGARRPLVIVAGARAVPVTHILTNLRTAGVNRAEFFELLEQVR